MRHLRIVLVAILGLGFLVSSPLAAQRHRTRSGSHRSAPTCSKGIPCGKTCIPAGRTCHVGEAPSTGAPCSGPDGGPGELTVRQGRI